MNVSVGLQYIMSAPSLNTSVKTALFSKNSLLKALEYKTPPPPPPTTVRRKLGELCQCKESPAEFAEEVRCLVSLGYPGTDLLLQDQLATDVFLKGLRNQKVAYEVMNRDPPSLAEAQMLAELHKHNFKATLGREVEMRPGRTLRISWADEGENVPDNFCPTSRRLQSPKYVTEYQLKMLMDKVEQLNVKLERLQTVSADCGTSTSFLANRKQEQ